MYRKIAIITTLPLIVLGFTLIKNTLAQTIPALILTPSATSAQINDTVTVALDAQGVENLGAYQVTLTYNPALVSVENAAISNFLASTGRTVGPVGPTINNTTGTVTLGAFSFGSQAGPSGNGTLATFTLKALSNGTTSLDLSNVSVTDVDGNTISNLAMNPVAVTIGASVSPSPSGAPASGSATLSLTGPQTTVINQPATYELMLSTSEAITGVDAVITFDPQAVTVDSVTDNHLLSNTPANTIDPTGTIRFSAVANPNEPYTGSGSLASIVLTPKTAGNISIAFTYTAGNKADSNVIEATTGADILATPTPLSLTVVDEASLSLSLSTPSENSNGHSLNGTLSQSSGYTASVSANAEGVTDPVDLDSSVIGTLQTYFFKASGYLKEKFDLTVESGLNTVSLGLLKAGDLNDDGIVNSLDLSLMYDQWFKTGSADFNRDGTVNSADHWHLINNFLKEDE